MSKTWVGFGLAVAAIVGITAYVVVRAKTPDLGPAGPNRELAPETLAVYAEFPDVAGTWSRLQKTDSWQDLASSKIAERALAAEQVKALLAALDQVAEKASYALDAKNAMKFLGRECSVGLAPDPAGGPPNVLVLTKLDVEALSKDFLGGKVNLDALWGELQRRTGKCDFAVTASEYRGHRIATATREGAAFHATLLGDTLAVATDQKLVRDAVDCRLAHGARSVGRRAAFLADVKSLPAGTAAFEWFDLDALDAGRNSLDAGLATLGASPEALAAIHALLEGTRGAHSVALSEVLPDGDLYRSSWTLSKSDDLFADQAAPQLRSFFAGDWIAYGELRDIGAVAEAYGRSALCRKLGGGEIGKWFQRQVDDPGPALGRFFAELTGGSGAARAPKPRRAGDTAPAPEPEPSPAAAANAVDEGLALVDTFAVRMGRHIVSEQAKALVNGETAGGVDWTGRTGETPRFAWTIRLDVRGRLLALAAQAGAMEAEKGRIVYEQIGPRRVFAADSGASKLYWVLVGDAFLLSNDHEVALAAARSGTAAPLPPSKRLDESILSAKAGWRAFAYVDWERARTSVAKELGSSPSLDEFNRVLDTYDDLGVIGHEISMAAYVPDDFGSIEIRSRMRLSPPRSAEAKALRTAYVDREPLVWASLPDTTIVSTVNYPGTVPNLWTLVKSLLGPKVADAASAFRESMGMDLEKELIPALGPEFSLAVTFRPAPPPSAAGPGGPGPFLPGFLLGVEVRDPVVVKRAIDRALELAEKSLREESPDTPAKPFVREVRNGAEVVRMDVPASQQGPVPLHPALSLQDGYLLVSTETDVLLAAVDARNGKARRFADSPMFARATAALGRKCGGCEILDWSRLADEVREYAPQMGGLFAGDDVPFPEQPADGNQQEWNRRLEEYQKKVVAAQASGGDRARAWIDSFRVIDFAGVTTRVAGDVAESTFVVRFAE